MKESQGLFPCIQEQLLVDTVTVHVKESFILTGIYNFLPGAALRLRISFDKTGDIDQGQ